ncbi:MAG: hypothetical protein QM767_13265 [Anaeromyxobacter sp.]
MRAPILLVPVTLALACAGVQTPAPPPPTSAPAPRAEATPPAGAKAPAPAAQPGAPGKAAAAPAPRPPARGDGLGPAEFWPLAVGNEWSYVDQSPAIPAARGKVHTVRVIERMADGYYRDDQRAELRVDGDCVHDRQRRLLCRPLAEGNAWSSVVSVSSVERFEIAAVNETVEVPAGRFEGCVRVRSHNRASPTTDHILEITYAPLVGPVRIETFVVVDGRVTPQSRNLLQSYKVAPVGRM